MHTPLWYQNDIKNPNVLGEIVEIEQVGTLNGGCSPIREQVIAIKNLNFMKFVKCNMIPKSKMHSEIPLLLTTFFLKTNIHFYNEN